MSPEPHNEPGSSGGMPVVDAHHHLWRYSREEYAWMGDEPGPLGRDFLGADLAQVLDACGVGATVAVQARESAAENRFLLDQAAAESRIGGIVGWVPFRQAGVCAGIERLAAEPLVKGVRHVIQGEADARAFVALKTFNDGLRTLQRLGLRYDLLVVAAQLEAVTSLVDRHPDLPVVLDHIGKPRIAGLPPAAWRAGVRELAARPNVCCKLSGLVTEVPGGDWDLALLRPYFETVLEAFGPQRLMFGSDWPVCLRATGYARWLQAVRDLTAELAVAEQEWILSRTAREFYGLNP